GRFSTPRRNSMSPSEPYLSHWLSLVAHRRSPQYRRTIECGALIPQIASHEDHRWKTGPKRREVTMRASLSSSAPAHSYAEQRREARGDVQSATTDNPLFEKRYERADAAPAEFSFGAFRLLPAQFLLLQGDDPVPLGSRALEILIVLLDRAGELVSKQELMAHVWPNIFVEPANLTVHISALRRVLRDGQDGNRFIINIPGRGYCFVAPVELSGRENNLRNGFRNSAYMPRTAPSRYED